MCNAHGSGYTAIFGDQPTTSISVNEAPVLSNTPGDTLLTGFQLGACEVRPREEKIRSASGEQHLEPKVMQVLLMLARHPGQVVTRDALLNQVWSDTVVGDEVLSRAISLLRGALGDERTNPKYIRTVPRQGYELICPVTPLLAAAKPRWPLYTAITSAVLAVLLIVATSMERQAPFTVAVIPFSVEGTSATSLLSGDGFADYLTSALTRSPDLSVVARHTSFALRDNTMDIHTIREHLDASYLVEGSLLQLDESLVLTLELVDAERNTSVWTEQITGSPNTLSALQASALAALSTALEANLGIRPLKATQQQSLPDTRAYLRYLEARYQWSLRGELRINRAIELLREAIERDPGFARAHLGLAQSLAVEPIYTAEPIGPAFELARASSARAGELDPALRAEIQALEGWMLMSKHQWSAAEDALLDSLERDPDSALAHYFYSILLSQFGDYARALAHSRTAARLEPMSAVINNRLALAYLWMNQDSEAARQYGVSSELGFLERTQVKPYVLLALRLGRFEEIESALLDMGNSPDWVLPFVMGLRDPELRAEATIAIEQNIESGNIDRRFWFGIWVLFNDAERAFRDFDASPKTQDIELLWAAESEFLRQDNRFTALLERLNLTHLINR